MKIRANLWQNICLSILSGILILLSFPKFASPQLNSIFSFVMFVPLFIAIFNTKTFNLNIRAFSLSTFYFSLLTSIIGYCGIFYWVVPTFKVAGENQLVGSLATFLLAFYCSLYLIIFCYNLKAELSIKNILQSASFWVLLEIVRGNILSGFPWMLVGYSQYNFLSFIQIAEFGGVYLISFVVIMVNLILANTIFFAIKDFKRYKLKIFVSITFLIITFFLITNYGQKRINNLNYKISSSKEKLNIILLQGNIDQYKKWDNQYRNEILNNYSALVSSANSVLHTSYSILPTLFVWPESSVPGWLLEEKDLYNWFKNLVIKTNSYHLVGTVFYGEAKNMDEYYNGAILFNPEGNILQKYAKIHLVPFGEYVPFRNFLSKYIKTINELGEFTSGKEFTVFKLKVQGEKFPPKAEPPQAEKVKSDVKSHSVLDTKSINPKIKSTTQPITFSTLICYESIFPELTSKFVTNAFASNGAEFLVNITNDAWYLKTSAPYQLFIFNIFRAIENRTFVLRSANTGISGIISPTGKVLQKTELFTTEYLMKELNLYYEPTFYTKNNHLIWLIFLGLYLICKIFTSKTKL